MNGNLSLYELNLLIGNTIKTQLPDYFWVVAEINQLTENRQGHCYLELIEKDAVSDQIRASARGIIWSSKYRMLKPHFEHSTGQSLGPSIKLLIRVVVEHHPVYGLSLLINDIDPNYTLGDIARKRLETIQKLEEAGVFDMNKTLKLAPVIQHIAVISSASAAGYGDFVDQLFGNPAGYGFRIKLFEAVMQGQQTEKSVIEALNHIYNSRENFDVVAIVRGGGSKTDLAAFDSFDIAFYITQFPIPVISGIGHERDESITDMVAHTRCKTPTAVASFIVDRNTNYEFRIKSLYDEIELFTKRYLTDHNSLVNHHAVVLINKSYEVIKRHQQVLHRLQRNTQQLARQFTGKQHFKLNYPAQRLSSALRLYLQKQDSKLKQSEKNIKALVSLNMNRHNITLQHLEKSISLAHPENILKRGFSITRVNGKSLKSIHSISLGDNLQTELIDGIVNASVTNTLGK